MALSRQQLLSLARQGAIARIQELKAEIANLTHQFTGALGRVAGDDGDLQRISQKRRVRRKRGQLSAAGRQAIAAAQRARWAKIKQADSEMASSGGGKKRKGMSAANRKAAAERMRAYWKAKKAAKKR